MALWGLTDALASAPKWLAPKHTFAGTSAFVVAANTDTITIPAHGIADLERLTLVILCRCDRSWYCSKQSKGLTSSWLVQI